jgi:hypothetical protein
MHRAPANTQTSSWWPTAPADAGSATGSTKARCAAVDPAAACGPTTPATRTTKPTRAIDTTARTAFSEHRVPEVIKAQPTIHSPAKERVQWPKGPPKSAKHRRATEPNAANRAVWSFPTP